MHHDIYKNNILLQQVLTFNLQKLGIRRLMVKDTWTNTVSIEMPLRKVKWRDSGG